MQVTMLWQHRICTSSLLSPSLNDIDALITNFYYFCSHKLD